MIEAKNPTNNTIDSSESLECLLCHNKEAYIMNHGGALVPEGMVCEVYCPHCSGLFGWSLEEKETIAELKKYSDHLNHLKEEKDNRKNLPYRMSNKQAAIILEHLREKGKIDVQEDR